MKSEDATISRTPDEILARVRHIIAGGKDILGFETDQLIRWLPYPYAKEFLIANCKEQWDARYTPPTRETLKIKMLEYMEFAWEKANNFRGICAMRSIGHYISWMWVYGDDGMEVMGNTPYDHYGKEILVDICQFFEWDYSEWDDGVRLNSEPHNW